MSGTRESDIEQLRGLLDGHADELSEKERDAFTGMLDRLVAYGTPDGRYKLSDGAGGQREWLRNARARLIPEYENLVSRGLAPRGREVPTPAVLLNLPKKPPTRRPP